MNSKKIGIVLSGGGARGYAHLGLLQAMEESGLRPDMISGVSAGAIVGAFYASGHKPLDILSFMKENSFMGWTNFKFKGDGFFSMKPLLTLLEKQISTDSFESLSIPLCITTTDFTNYKSIFFSKGPLFQVVLASASVPVIFEPLSIGGSLMVDGSVLNNFPVEPLEKKCSRIIGCYVNNLEPISGPSHKIGKTRLLERCLSMATSLSVYSKKNRCNLFIEPRLDQFGIFDEEKADQIFEIGYKASKRKKRQWETFINE